MFKKIMIFALLLTLLTCGGSFATQYGPGVWIQKGYDGEAFEHQTGPLSGTAILGVFPSAAANPASFYQNIAGDSYLLCNAFYDGAAWQGNIASLKSLSMVMNATTGAFSWNYAAAGTTPSFAQTMGLSSAGALTVGASLDRLVAGTLSLGTTTANAITIGSTGVTTTNAGAFTSTQTLTATAAAAFNGDTDIGNAATDTLTVTAVVDSDLTFVKEVARVIKVADTTTAATAGANLTVQPGRGTTGGGNLALLAGACAAGTNGIVQIGTTNTSALTLGATTITTTSTGPLTVSETLTANGDTTLGNAAADAITLTGTIAGNVTLLKEVAHTISVAASTTTDTVGAALTVAAGDGVGTGGGGNTIVRAGNAGSGTDGILQLGVTNTSGITLGASTIITTSTGPLAVSEAFTANGDSTLGNAAADNVTVTGTVNGNVTFLKEAAHTVSVAASTTTDTVGAALTVAAGDGVGTGGGGALNLNGGNAGSGTDGAVNVGAANTSGIALGADTNLADAKAITFGTSADINIEYDGTDNALDESLGAAAHSANINLTATATCTEGMAIMVNSTTVADATADTKLVMGICRVGAAGAAVATIAAQGTVPAVTDALIDINRPLKACTGGRVGEAIDSTNANREISSATGGGFANQPANDSITLVSDSAGDTQNVTLYGTTNGTDTVVVEVIALTGVTPVVTVKANWGELLGIELSSQAVGTITLTETSGGLTITTLVATNTSKGVFTVVSTAGANRAFNAIPYIVADAGTTKQFGIVNTSVAYAAVTNNSVNLNGTTPVPMVSAANTVTKLLVGDVEAARTVYLCVRATDDDTELIIGRSLEAATAKDQTKRILLEKGH